MTEKEFKIPFNAPLDENDTPNKTFGCRANNPNICANSYLDNVCAFVCDDHICKQRSKRWSKQYDKLKSSG